MRRDFQSAITGVNAIFANAGSFGGSAHRHQVHRMCAAQLHARVAMALESLWASHGAMSASSADTHRRACKDWMAARINGEAEDLQQYLRWAHPGYAVAGRNDNPMDDLLSEAKREIESSYAEIDNGFDRLQRSLVERATRRCVRTGRTIAALFSAFRGI
jgi:hypothetical protein